MAKLKIVKEGDPILRKKSREVTEITPRIITLLDDMIETMRAADGCGLAAVQVGVLKRVVIVETEETGLVEMINPRIVSRKGEQKNVEGCLSVPERWGVILRPEQVTVKAQNRKGEFFEIKGEGLAARAFCHELDHLEGILFRDVAIQVLNREELDALIEENK
jgi:peptide deformylase